MIPNPFRTLALSTALAVFAGGALAQQTAPNTLVSNTIALTYNSGDGTPTVTLPEQPSHTIEFRVDRKLDLGVIAQSGGGVVPVVPGQSAVTFSYLVENRGNGTQGFVIDVTDTGNIDVAGGLTRSTTVTTDPGQFYVLIGPNADGTGSTIYNGGNAGNLDPGEAYYVVIVANIPITALDAQLEDFVVRATVADAGTATPVVEARDQGLLGVNRVFADAASNSTREPATVIDTALNGQDADETRLEVRAPVITAQKEVVVLDEALPGSTFNCIDGGAATGDPLAAIPGACVEYTITVQNTSPSSTTATSIAITDPLPTTLTFVAVDNVTYSAGGSNASAPVHNGTNPGGTVSVTIDELPASSTATFRIRATIN